jgi:mannan endo-1,4-beta-mannosidase
MACLLGGAKIALAENAGFVKTSGTRFLLEGSLHYYAGANYWQGMNLGMADAAGGNRERLGRELDHMKALGLVNLRVMALSEGPDSAPYRMRPSLQPAPGVFNEAVFEGLDHLLQNTGPGQTRTIPRIIWRSAASTAWRNRQP